MVAAGDDSEEEFTDFNYEAYDEGDSDMGVEGVDVMVTPGAAAGNPMGVSFVDPEGKIDLRFAKAVKSIILTKIPNAKTAIAMHTSEIAMHTSEIARHEEEIKYWELVINSYQ